MPVALGRGAPADPTADTLERLGSAAHGQGRPPRPPPGRRNSAIHDRALERNPCSVEATPALCSTRPGAFFGPPVLDGNTSDDPPDSLAAHLSTSSAPVLNGTANSRPAFILDAGIVHIAASMSISSQRAPRASPGRTAVSAIISTHSAAAGCASVVRLIARSAGVTSRFGGAGLTGGAG